MNVKDCIFFMLAKANQAGTRYWSHRLTDLNLTAVQAMVLNFLGQQEMVTSKELGERTGLDSATLTGVLDRLETSGLIERQRHPKDRRAICIGLTPNSRTMVPRIQERLDEANRDFLSGLSHKDRNELRRLLRAVRAGTKGATDRVI